MKKIIFIIIGCLIFIFFGFAARTKSKEDVLNIKSSQIVKFAKEKDPRPEASDNDIIINEEDGACAVDTDCTVASISCGDCSLDAVNKKYREKYKSELEQICKNHKIACDTDYRLTHEIKCVDLKCRLVTK